MFNREFREAATNTLGGWVTDSLRLAAVARPFETELAGPPLPAYSVTDFSARQPYRQSVSVAAV